jgi:hypothetical protein
MDNTQQRARGRLWDPYHLAQPIWDRSTPADRCLSGETSDSSSENVGLVETARAGLVARPSRLATWLLGMQNRETWCAKGTTRVTREWPGTEVKGCRMLHHATWRTAPL